MIYLDSSVALADILGEAPRPSAAFWLQRMTSSRLLQYEVWNRLHARQASAYRHGKARAILRRVVFVEMTATTLARSLLPFTPPVRTLDALHLATMDYLRVRGAPTTLASYDARLVAAAQAEGFGIVQP